MKAPGEKVAELPGPIPSTLIVPPLVAAKPPPMLTVGACVTATVDPTPSADTPPPSVVVPVPVPVRAMVLPEEADTLLPIVTSRRPDTVTPELFATASGAARVRVSVLPPTTSPLPVIWTCPPFVRFIALLPPKA